VYQIPLLILTGLLLLSGCGRTAGNTDSLYLPSNGITLAEQNRHDLMASSHLEKGIQYVISTPEENSEATDDTDSEKTSDTDSVSE
jgi:hypothetical protein